MAAYLGGNIVAGGNKPSGGGGVTSTYKVVI